MNHSQKVQTIRWSSLKNSTWNQLTSKIPNMTCTQMKVFIFLLSWWQKLISDPNFVLCRGQHFVVSSFPNLSQKTNKKIHEKLEKKTSWLTGGDNPIFLCRQWCRVESRRQGDGRRRWDYWLENVEGGRLTRAYLNYDTTLMQITSRGKKR